MEPNPTSQDFFPLFIPLPLTFNMGRLPVFLKWELSLDLSSTVLSLHCLLESLYAQLSELHLSLFNKYWIGAIILLLPRFLSLLRVKLLKYVQPIHFWEQIWRPSNAQWEMCSCQSPTSSGVPKAFSAPLLLKQCCCISYCFWFFSGLFSTFKLHLHIL